MLGYRHSLSRSSGQLQSLANAREQEAASVNNAAVDAAGELLEYETLELRIHPPNVRIDNEADPHHTVLIIDSANRPGTLVEVVQLLTELALSVRHARISSDGGWFVDEFHISETPSGRVLDPKKLDAITRVLSLPEHTGDALEVHTVFQLAGPETPGLLAEVTQLLSHNGLEIRSAAAWTYCGRAAIVLGVTEHNAAVRDSVKLQRLQQLLTRLVASSGLQGGGSSDNVAVAWEHVEGPVHHERRLHQLLLADQVQALKELARLQRQHSLPFPGPVHTQLPAASQQQQGQADTAGESDQALPTPHTPTTPQQQWQRQMLPPTWTVDPRGRPMAREELRQQQLQLEAQPWPYKQQQQQHEALGADPQHHDVQHEEGDGDIDPFRAASAAMDCAGSNSMTDQQHHQQQAAGGSVASAVAASTPEEQASVDKLIALLQPQQPLAHAISLPASPHSEGPPGAAAVGGPQHAATAAAPAGSTVQQQQQPQQAASTHALTEPLPQPLTSAGLLPRRPAAAVSGLPPAPLVVSGAAAPTGGSGGLSTASAPCSPCAAAAPGGGRSRSGITGALGAQAGLGALLASGGGAGAGGDASATAMPGQPPWSPHDFASAAAAAGLLSPSRALPRVGAPSSASSSAAAPALRPDAPEVQIQPSHLFNYWLVEIRCRDRNKLLFDTVCTLADMRFDVHHAAIDSLDNGTACQLFYIRPRFGEPVFDSDKAAVLKAMLESAVQRRFPPGLRVHVFAGSSVCLLQDLVSSFKQRALTITRCKVRAYDNGSHTFFLLSPDGSLPSRQVVQRACQAAGGELVDAPLDPTNPCVATVLRSLDARGRFAFSFQRQAPQLPSMQQQQQPHAWLLRSTSSSNSGLPLPPPSAGSRGVLAPGGPVDMGGVLVGGGSGGDGGVHGAVSRRGSSGTAAPLVPRPAAAPRPPASYDSSQPSF